MLLTVTLAEAGHDTGATCDTDTEADALAVPAFVVPNTTDAPSRTDPVVFAAAVNSTDVVPALPDDGDAVTHKGNPVTDHDVFDDT